MTCLPVLLLATLASLHNEGWTPVPRALLFAETEKVSVALDPSGTRVGWLTGAAEQRVLQIAALASPDQPATLDLPGLAAWTWSPGGEVLAITSTETGDRLLVVDASSGERRDRTPTEGASLRFVGTSPHRPQQLAIMARTADDESSGVYRVTLAGDGAAERLMGLSGFDRVFVDGQLEPRLATRPLPEGAALLRRTSEDGWVEHARYGWEAARLLGVVALSTDGKTASIVDDTGLDKAALKALDVESGKERVLCQDPLADLLPAGATVDPATGSVQAVVTYFAHLRRHVLDPSLAADFEALASVHRGDVSFVGRSADDRTWLVRFMDGGPFDYYAYDRASRRATRLFSDLPALDGHELAARSALAVPASDGLLLACHLYLPPGSDADGDGRPERPLPTVLYVHGGPWVGFEWNSWLTNRSLQLLADRGYAAVRTDFRGAGGYGRAFMDAGDRQWGGDMQADLRDIKAFLVEQGIADEQRVALWGWSYGGYATLAGLAFTPDEFAAGVAMYGVYDLVRFIEALQDGGFGADLWYRRVGDLRTDEGRQLLREHSPLNAVERITRPLLVTHGGRDSVVPQRQSDLLVEALEAAGHGVTYFVYPDEPHDYRQAVSWTSFWSVAERFLAEHLGGRFEPSAGELSAANVEFISGVELVPGLAAELPEASARADGVPAEPPPR